MAEPIVTGVLIIPAGTPAFHHGVAHITLEDVSYADALADKVAETTITDVDHARADQDTAIPFALHLGASGRGIEAGKDYIVRAWVDHNGEGHMSAGDLITDQSYRVLTAGYGSTVTLMLKQV